jgi:hypothetical protein
MSLSRCLRYIPAGLTIAYILFYTAILLRYTIWPIGDQSDVVHEGVAAFSGGFIASFVYPGGRTGTFVCVSIFAAINAVLIYMITRRLLRKPSFTS